MMVESVVAATSSRLEDHVHNMRSPREIAAKYQIPTAYLDTLEVRDTTERLNDEQCYELSRHLLDVHYLSLALNHQGYPIDADLPIMQLLFSNFPGVRSYLTEGRFVMSHVFPEYFEKHSMYCRAMK